jgi:hypothetical protein
MYKSIYIYIRIYIYTNSKKPPHGTRIPKTTTKPPHGIRIAIDRHRGTAGATDTAEGPERPSTGAAGNPSGSTHREHPSGAPIGRGDPHLFLGLYTNIYLNIHKYIVKHKQIYTNM